MEAEDAGHAEAAGRDPSTIGLQQMLDVPPRDKSGKGFYADLDQVEARAVAVKEMGFEWGALNATAIFQSGARSVTNQPSAVSCAMRSTGGHGCGVIA